VREKGSNAGRHLVDRDKGRIVERADNACATTRLALDLKDGTNHTGTVVHDA
jgi:hypothetical protein